ncbi:hypothetical protein C8250_038995 [Streptomyces sp. So13.3]|nr:MULTISPECIES: hypothetical protein [unclassified Streptomyces]MCZ4102940.1 hypothetical protein [Streptomyces sp. H39-C1]QNA77055.1 hypothetical protein C8250_038995 [Streptomyces sp. So13.3]
MNPYLALPLLLIASLIAAVGLAAVTRGWVLPRNRRHVRNPRLYGWGQLIVAFALCWQLVFGMLSRDPETRAWGTLTGAVMLVAGFIVAFMGQLTSSRRKGSSTR